MKFTSVAIASLIFAMAGCSHTPTKQQIGTATGAVVGGAAGAVLTGTTTGAVIGAGAGAVVGSEIGKSMEKKR
jgi:osmotically inducible lipoprotein OsmB